MSLWEASVLVMGGRGGGGKDEGGVVDPDNALGVVGVFSG